MGSSELSAVLKVRFVPIKIYILLSLRNSKSEAKSNNFPEKKQKHIK